MLSHLNLLTNHALRLYDREISAFAKGLPADKRHPEVRLALQKLREQYVRLYQDAQVQQQAEWVVSEWARDFEENSNRLRIREAWKAVLQGKVPTSSWEMAVAAMVVTRQQRWERLAAQLGLAVPTGFLAYRGVQGIAFVEAVAASWASGRETFRVRQHELASWSLVEASAQRFANRGDASAVYVAVIPFVQTLADKWVDGGKFVIPYHNQYELIAGASIKNGIEALTKHSKIRYRNRWYSYADRETVFSLLRQG